MIWNAFYLKLARGIPVVVLSTVLAFVLPLSSDESAAVALITLGMLFDTLARTLLYTFNAFERGELAAAIVTTDKLLAAALGLAVLAAGYGVVAVAATFTVGTAAKLLMGFVLLFRRIRRPAWHLPPEQRRDLRRRSLPFTVEDIFGLILARIDVLLLSALATGAIVGLYGSAYRLIDSTTFIVVALSGAFTAMYTYLGPDTTPTLQSVFQRSIKLTLTLLLPIAIAFGVVAEPLCRLFFGDELAAAGDSLRILAPMVVLFGVIVMSTNLVVSRSDPMRVVKVVAAVAVVNLGLNVALIPSMEAEGAALAMLVSEVLYVGLALRLAVPLAGGVHWLPTLAAPAAAGAAMAAAMLPLDGTLGIALLAGAAAYAAVFAAVEALVDPSDLRFIAGLVCGAPARAPRRAGGIGMSAGSAPSVLHVAQPADYGVPRVAGQLVRDQAARGWRVAVACPPVSDLGAVADELGIPRHDWQATRSPGPTVPGELRRFRHVLRAADPDVVHLHSAKAGLVGRLALRGRRATLFQPHAWSFAAVGGPLHTATVAWERVGARWADAIVTVSDDERASGESAGVRGRYATVPNGVDLTGFPPATEAERRDARATLGLGDGPIAVVPARIFEQKGQDVALEAWPSVLRAVPDARLVFVGDGPERDRLAALGVDGVDWMPPTNDVGSWMAAANVVVFPSRWEAGLSLGVMEAMARARSVVATDVWGTRDGLAAGGGAIVPVDAVEPLADAIAERLADPARADAEGATGRKRIETDYDLRRTNGRMAELTLEVLQRRSGSSSS